MSKIVLGQRVEFTHAHNPDPKSPSDYNQSLTSPGALRRRLLKYVIPVIAFSVAFNIPKFFEAQIVVRTEQLVLMPRNLLLN